MPGFENATRFFHTCESVKGSHPINQCRLVAGCWKRPGTAIDHTKDWIKFIDFFMLKLSSFL